MKVVSKSIDVIEFFEKDGGVKPLRFRISEDEEEKVIKINRVVNREIEKLAGNVMEKFVCIASVNGVERIFEIKYELLTKKWILFKF
ncbi:MAG: hypothetical protein E6923_12860 [Clostridium sp.]|uniref:hypothetical protein n=1 Tax=Clostridium sp. TaxID=1506 RepID=UPI0029045132|nr:hypothetical protein [Clostridium sp.]MDU1311988.1 hypothetical protein [Clostridium sp.]MDU1408747.1 hypothetical protein [Clostridium sp.]